MPYFYVGSEGGEEFVQEQQTAFELDREINSVLATDCGSTTTKAILIEKVGDEYRLIVQVRLQQLSKRLLKT